MKASPDEDISMEISKGNSKAFSHLYDKYAPALLGILYRMNLTNDSAELIIERVFKIAWNQSKEYDRSKVNLFSWLSLITRREAISFFNEQPGLGTAIKQNEEISNPKIFSHLYNEAFLQNNLSASLTLPERSCMEMMYVYNFTADQISYLTKISVQEVKSSIKIAIGKLSLSFKN